MNTPHAAGCPGKWIGAAFGSAILWTACQTPAFAQCPTTPLCRSTKPDGALLHNPNSQGNRVWTTSCGPNTTQRRPDATCEQIAACPQAGGFGKFLRAVTFNCKVKHFDGYFGLDGMTFGILDWTSNELPDVLHAFQERDEGGYRDTLGKLSLPMHNGCLDSKWVCDSNKTGKLMCDANFHDAFVAALKTPGLQKAQVDVALSTYEKRLARYKSLELKSEYGNTAMAVVANNLRSGSSCRPATWKQQCAMHKSDETKLVDCMLDRYVQNSCRGSQRGSIERRDAIKAAFRNESPSGKIHPSVDEVIACATSWGNSR